MTEQQILETAHRMAWRYKKSSDPAHSDTFTFNQNALLAFVAVMSSPIAQPVQPAAAQLPQTSTDSYGKTDFGFTFAGAYPSEGAKRLMAMLVEAFGTDHPSVDDLTALIFSVGAQPVPQATPITLMQYGRCSKTLRALGKAYPRTCAECGFGPCKT